MATKRKWPPFKVRFVFALGAKARTSCWPSFPRVFPLSNQSGKLEDTSEKPWGVPPIFLALYFVKQKYVSPQQKC